MDPKAPQTKPIPGTDRTAAVQKILAELDLEKVAKLKNALDSGLDQEFMKRAAEIDRMGAEGAERLKAILEMEGVIADQFGMKKSPWTPKRIAWAVAAVLAGVGAAYLCQKKLPAMNHAACGVTGGLAFEQLGLRGQKAFLGNAAGGLGGVWLNQNCQAAEVALAAPAFAYTMFTAGEDFMAAWKERKLQQEAEEKKKAAAQAKAN
jgi:hypothetical protein